MLGTLLIALALGAGAQSRVSMGIAVIGGLLFSGGLTLYVIPAIYSYLSRKTVVVAAPEQNGNGNGTAKHTAGHHVSTLPTYAEEL